jgi:uncharacterized protein (TIGR00296 family)
MISFSEEVGVTEKKAMIEGRSSAKEKNDGSQEIFGAPDGKLIVGAARTAVQEFLKSGKRVIPEILAFDKRFETKRGCFVTFKEDDGERTLRGCIGFPEPIFRLLKAIPEAAIAAATEDPRFPPIKAKEELDKLLTEVSILTAPEPIDVESHKDLPKMIVVGRDGLILRWSFGTGLLLPQVAAEYNSTPEEFLCNVAMKAGAPPDQWLLPETQLLRFRSLIFGEESPLGDVTFRG